MSLDHAFKYKYYSIAEKSLFRGQPLTSLSKEELLALLAWKLEQSAKPNANDPMKELADMIRGMK